MAKNSFFSRFFGEEAKAKSMLSKLKKMKKEFDILDNKLLSGKISKSELDRYYVLKEEINKMAKKFTLKDGKFVLKTDQDGEKMNDTNPNTAPAPAPNPAPAPAQPVEQPIPQPQPVDNSAQIAAMQREQEQRAQAQAQAQHEAQMMAQAQAQHEAQMRAQAQAQHEAQMRAQQQASLQQPRQAPPQNEGLATVYLTVSDLPELSLGIKQADVPVFAQAVNKAMVSGEPFEFGPVVVNGSKILMYRFD